MNGHLGIPYILLQLSAQNGWIQVEDLQLWKQDQSSKQNDSLSIWILKKASKLISQAKDNHTSSSYFATISCHFFGTYMAPTKV